jgi:hypothetical protein
MDVFPFTKEEWQSVQDASYALVVASEENDAVLLASCKEELFAVLADLRNRHGEHPILLETEADFEDDATTRCEKYRSAIRLAENHIQPTYTIRLSLAGVLLRDFDDPSRALKELNPCKSELMRNADAGEKKEWTELFQECEKRLKSRNQPGK